MALLDRRIGFTLGLAATLAAFAVQPAPAAAADVGDCTALLARANQARTSLESLFAALARGESDRAAWMQRTAEIDSELAGLVGEKNEHTKQLRRERADLVKELRTLDKLHPVITNQAEALRAQVEETERAYIACIETTI